MNKEVTSYKQKILLISLFLSGSSSIFIIGIEVKQDFWIAIILAIFIELIVVYMYARLHYIFPEKDLFDIIEICFGKYFGRIIMLLYTGYIFEYIARFINYFGVFTTTSIFQDTPKLVPVIGIVILSIWVVKEGVEVICRCSNLLFFFMVSILFISILLLNSQMNTNNLYPILDNNMKTVFKVALYISSYPFGEIVVFTMIFSDFHNKKSPYKIYSLGLFLSGIILIAASLMNILVLGVEFGSSLYFPLFSLMGKLKVSEVLKRMEIVPSIIFVIGSFVKTSVLLLAISKGIAKIFICEDYRFIVVPISLLAINIAYVQFNSVMEIKEFYSKIIVFYSLPFKVILPIMILIIGEINKKQSCTELQSLD